MEQLDVWALALGLGGFAATLGALTFYMNRQDRAMRKQEAEYWADQQSIDSIEDFLAAVFPEEGENNGC